MRALRFVGPLVVSGLVVVACSSGGSSYGSGGPGVPDGATSLQCTSFEVCPNLVCSCDDGVVNARQCVNGYCLDQPTTCNDVCSKRRGDAGGGDGDAPKRDGSVPAAGEGDPCVPVSTTTIVPRVGGIAARILGHQTVPPTPANGSVNVTKTASGAPSYISYDAPGTAGDYTDSFTYDSGGRLTYFSHNADGSVSDYTDSFTYDSSGRVTYLSHNADGFLADFTESFTYDSGGHMTYWSYNPDGSVNDVTESFTYDSGGHVTYFSHNADGSANDVTESFTYDAAGRMTYWSYRAGADSATVSVSYGSSSQNVSTSGPRAAGAQVKVCK